VIIIAMEAVADKCLSNTFTVSGLVTERDIACKKICPFQKW